jgi:hypothetical protein
MKIRTWMFMVLATLLACGMLAGCATPAPTQAGTGNSQLANPWIDATPAQAAQVLGGTFYNFTTLDSAYKQYALLVTTDAAIAKGDLPPTAWVRYKKGDADVSMQMFKGAKLSADELKGTQAGVNAAAAYILHNGDGTAQISWETDGILFKIGTNSDWTDAALTALAQGVKAVN